MNLQQLLVLAERRESCPKSLLEAVSRCPEVEERLLGTVNSGRYGQGEPVSSARAAHVRVGHNSFRHLVMVSASLERTPLLRQ